MTDIMVMAAFDDYGELMATGSAISLIASVGACVPLSTASDNGRRRDVPLARQSPGAP